MPIKEQFLFRHMQSTIIKQMLDNGQCERTIARRRPVAIPATFDFVKETVTVGSITYKVKYNGEFTYKVNLRSKVIEATSYENFVRHIKVSAERDSIWHFDIWRLLKKLAHGNVQELN